MREGNYIRTYETRKALRGKSDGGTNKKSYKVTVTFVQITDEEAKIKLSIIENIIKRGCSTKE